MKFMILAYETPADFETRGELARRGDRTRENLPRGCKRPRRGARRSELSGSLSDEICIFPV